jgi:hypothetical protein
MILKVIVLFPCKYKEQNNANHDEYGCYAEELAETYERNEPRVMRDFDKLMELIRMSAFLHQEQRVRFGVGDERSYLIANEYDFWVGRSLFDSVRETTVTGVPQPVIDFYDEVLCEIPGLVTYQSIREKYVEVHKMSLSRTRLRTKFLEPLEAVGSSSRREC